MCILACSCKASVNGVLLNAGMYPKPSSFTRFISERELCGFALLDIVRQVVLHDFEYQQHYEADEEVRLDALRERRRWHRHAPTHLHFRLRFGKENRASSFLSTHLALSFHKIGCGSETQNQINLFCASLILHYLCSYFHF
jgi:hypothetical protein